MVAHLGIVTAKYVQNSLKYHKHGDWLICDPGQYLADDSIHRLNLHLSNAFYF